MIYRRFFLSISLLLLSFFINGLCSRSANAQVILSDVTTAVTLQSYAYTLFNDEPVGNPNYLTDFTVTLLAPTPFDVTGIPVGWTDATDNSTYIFWYNTDPSLPYPHDIAPGDSLGGFSIDATGPSSTQNTPYDIHAWDHTTDSYGGLSTGLVLAPVFATVPEPSAKPFLGAMILGIGGLLFGTWRRSRQSKA